MENHPIPQDVTGFQFKLIGSLTVKQFAYVAAGCVLAVVIFYAPLIPGLVKFILIPLLAGAGAAFSFLPIEGRPLDVMMGHFFKALVTPNQYIYSKIGGKIAIFEIQAHPAAPLQAMQQLTSKHTQAHDPAKEQKLQAYLNSLHGTHQTALDQKEQQRMQSFFQGVAPVAPIQPTAQGPLQAPPPPQVSPTFMPPAPMPQEPQIDPIQKQPEPVVTQAPLATPAPLPVTPLQSNPAPQPMPDAQVAVPAVPEQSIQPQQATQPQPIAPEKPVVGMVRKIPTTMATSVGLPHTPDVPNVLLGIVRDPRGNILANILVEVKDKEGNPVRAFKTNTLGQFASATPLRDGVYTIEFEDPRATHTFDTIELTVNGQIISPIEVISHDEREELRKALFS